MRAGLRGGRESGVASVALLRMRRWSLTVRILGGLVVFAAIVPTPLAYARTSHAYESVITGVPTEGPGGKPVTMSGPLNKASSMTVHTGNLYVAERLEGGGIAGSESRTDEFAPSSLKPHEYEFISQLPIQPEPSLHRNRGIAFGTAAGETEMYLGQEEHGIGVFGVSLSCGSLTSLECTSLQKEWTGETVPSPPGSFERVTDVAVDHSTSPGDWASGDVFVDDARGAAALGHNVIDIIEPQAGGQEKYITDVTGPSQTEHFGEPTSIAVSGDNGDLVVGEEAGRNVYLFSPEEEGAKKGKYAFVKKLTPPGGTLDEVTAVAVDDSTGEIYVATITAVYEFGPEGAFRGEITGVPREGIPTGIRGNGEEVRFNRDTARPVSLTVDPASHRVFVGVFGSQVGPNGNNLADVDVFGEDVVVPDVVTEEPFDLELVTDGSTGAHSWSVLATGTVNPDSAGEVSCRFVYGTSKQSLDRVAPCGGTVPDGDESVPVDAGLSGLEPDTTYFYRLQATNAHGTNPGEESQDYEFTTPGPGLRSESVSGVSSSGATLAATIVPHDAPGGGHDKQGVTKSPTTYYFQYRRELSVGKGESTDGCVSEPSACTSVPLSAVSIGSGMVGVEVEQHVRGLVSGGTYHYRVVAINEVVSNESQASAADVAFYGPDRTFTTQGTGKPLVLPDRRVWELVSPADKHGAKIEPSGQAAVGGGWFTFVTDIPTESAPASNPTNGVQVLSSRRAPGEWSSVNIALSRSKPEGVLANGAREYRFFSEDLGSAFAESEGPFSVPEGWHKNEHGEWGHIVEVSPIPTERTPYLRHDFTCESAPSSCYEPLLDSEDVTSGNKYGGAKTHSRGEAGFSDATPDASHIAISSRVQLTSTFAPKGGLYEWSASRPAAQRLSLVSVLPDEIRVLGN